MRVDIEHAGQHPLPLGVDHLRAAGLVELTIDDGGDVPVPDADGAHRGRGA